jgi:hypothetical protein
MIGIAALQLRPIICSDVRNRASSHDVTRNSADFAESAGYEAGVA